MNIIFSMCVYLHVYTLKFSGFNYFNNDETIKKEESHYIQPIGYILKADSTVNLSISSIYL